MRSNYSPIKVIIIINYYNFRDKIQNRDTIKRITSLTINVEEKCDKEKTQIWGGKFH